MADPQPHAEETAEGAGEGRWQAGAASESTGRQGRRARERACWRRLCVARKRFEARLGGSKRQNKKYQDRLKEYETALSTGRKLKAQWERSLARCGADPVGYGDLAYNHSKRCFKLMCELDTLGGRCQWAAKAWADATHHLEHAEEEHRTVAEGLPNVVTEPFDPELASAFDRSRHLLLVHGDGAAD